MSVFFKPGTLIFLTILLGLGGSAYLAKGFRVAWQGGDGDLRIREREWAEFEKHVYPNMRLEQPVKSHIHSVYPPWALTMYAAFFGMGTFEAARVILQTLSLAALAAMMWMGWQELAPHGWRAGALGASLGPAISGNCTAIALGQFSIICIGFLALQLISIQRKWQVLGGLCWAFAMLKPQIALPFALLFLLSRQWVALFTGGAALLLLSAAAFAWTHVSPVDFFQASLASEKLSFVLDTGHPGTSWIGWLQVTPRLATALGLGILALLGGLLALRKTQTIFNVLPAARACAMLGFVLFYHRHYDNQMLFPLMLALVARMFQAEKRLTDFAMAGLLALTLYLPAGLVAQSETLCLLTFAAPIAAAAFVLTRKNAPISRSWRP